MGILLWKSYLWLIFGNFHHLRILNVWENYHKPSDKKKKKKRTVICIQHRCCGVSRPMFVKIGLLLQVSLLPYGLWLAQNIRSGTQGHGGELRTLSNGLSDLWRDSKREKNPKGVDLKGKHRFSLIHKRICKVSPDPMHI